MIDVENLSEPVEWYPFAVGDRVRLRHAPECRVQERGAEMWHGATGTVISDRALGPSGHRFLVRLDPPYDPSETPQCTASELEPLRPDLTRRAGKTRPGPVPTG